MYILELLLEKILIIISGLFNSNRFLKLQMSETHFTKQFWKLLGKEGGGDYLHSNSFCNNKKF